MRTGLSSQREVYYGRCPSSQPDEFCDTIGQLYAKKSSCFQISTASDASTVKRGGTSPPPLPPPRPQDLPTIKKPSESDKPPAIPPPLPPRQPTQKERKRVCRRSTTLNLFILISCIDIMSVNSLNSMLQVFKNSSILEGVLLEFVFSKNLVDPDSTLFK